MTAALTTSLVEPPNEAAYALLAQLHRLAFEPQGDSVWQAAAFRQLLESPGMQARVFHKGDHPVGFCLHRFVLDEAELIAIAVDPAFQKQGIATQMLNVLMSELGRVDVANFFLEVRQNNQAAITLYEKAGFRKVGVRKNYYENKGGARIDAVVFSFEFSQKR